MKRITSEKAYQKALDEVNALMKKGEDNVTDQEAEFIAETAQAIQAYEAVHYPFPAPKTLSEMVELKMFQKKLNRV